MSLSQQDLADLARIRHAAEQYAVGADRRDKALWQDVLTEDCVLEGPGFRTEGRDAVLRSIDLLDRLFRTTQHRVHQVIAAISGDEASGETYCTADHLLRDADAVMTWAIRYQDKWRRDMHGAWRLACRRLIVDWHETRPVTPGAPA